MTDPTTNAQEITITGIVPAGHGRLVTGPIAYRLARRDGQLILQACMQWQQGMDAGMFWEDTPTIDLPEAEG
jgi:hypothetical protein